MRPVAHLLRPFVAAAALCAPLLAHAQQPVKLKFATFSPDSERLFKTVLRPFVENVNKAAGGAIEIELYPSGALGRAPQQQAQMVLDGVADIAFIVPAFTPGRFPDSDVIELPNLFRDLEEGTKVFTRLVADGRIRDYGDYFPIAMWATPPFSLHANFPLTSLKDLKGKRVRASGVMQVEALKALGAVPVGMPPPEVPEALSRRTIDAATSQPLVVYDFGYDRVTHHHYFIRLGAVPLDVVMNRKKFDSLPKAGQDALRRYSMDWMEKAYVASMQEYDAQLIKRMQGDPKRKVVFPGKEDEEAARAAFEPVIKSWIGKSPRHAEVYAAARAEIEKVRAGR